MSWRKISRPAALPQGADAHRGEAARQITDAFTGGIHRGELGDKLDFLTGRTSRNAADLVRDVGTTAQVARLTGAAPRTIRDWRAGRHLPSADHLAALERAARRTTVQQLGGADAVAQLTGRSTSTVRAWVRKRTTAKGDAAHRLNVYEVRDRHRQARLQQGQDPAKPVYLNTKGYVRVLASTKTPSYDAERSVCHKLDQGLQDQITDAIARGDTGRVQALVEESLTSEYAALGDGLYNGDDLGFYLDRIDTIGLTGGRGEQQELDDA